MPDDHRSVRASCSRRATSRPACSCRCHRRPGRGSVDDASPFTTAESSPSCRYTRTSSVCRGSKRRWKYGVSLPDSQLHVDRAAGQVRHRRTVGSVRGVHVHFLCEDVVELVRYRGQTIAALLEASRERWPDDASDTPRGIVCTAESITAFVDASRDELRRWNPTPAFPRSGQEALVQLLANCRTGFGCSRTCPELGQECGVDRRDSRQTDRRSG